MGSGSRVLTRRPRVVFPRPLRARSPRDLDGQDPQGPTSSSSQRAGNVCRQPSVVTDGRRSRTTHGAGASAATSGWSTSWRRHLVADGQPVQQRSLVLVSGRSFGSTYRRVDETGSDIWKVPSSGGPSERVTNHAGRGPPSRRHVPVSPTADLVLQAADGDAPLIARDLDSGVERVVIDCVSPAVSTSGPRGVYYVGCTSAERSGNQSWCSTRPRGGPKSSEAVERWARGCGRFTRRKTLLVPLVHRRPTS